MHVTTQPQRASLFASSLAFVVGFSAVFISFGASASAVGAFLGQNRTIFTPVAGALIVLFGLHLLGILIKLSVRVGIFLGALLAALGLVAFLRSQGLFFGLSAIHFFSLSLIGFFGPPMTRWLNRDVRLRTNSTQPGIWSGFLLGFAFAFGWTPCIGPILTTVLALAAASDTVARGVLLLTVYSAGLAIPFLLTALLISQFLRFYQRFRKYLHAVELFSGALLLFVGGLIFVNKLTWMAGKLPFLNDIVLRLEKSTGAMPGMTDVSLLLAFLGGLVSFLSPCVLPLVPGYISMLSGVGMEQLRQGYGAPSAVSPELP